VRRRDQHPEEAEFRQSFQVFFRVAPLLIDLCGLRREFLPRQGPDHVPDLRLFLACLEPQWL